ncbi:MAG: F0F1 ATP synthase subunit epsilon [Actinomycetota bacterium]|nr:F0F1 ATP synthase subunit epsilon [Actinomycetota bacterium]MDQ3311784.1 F0F1 ATP synthase subunit epsilon [Actinomycetota bacterium]MDQ3351099.1 F0F1 ATP synthase subunit epsilon [Actinomycetota bacterium]
MQVEVVGPEEVLFSGEATQVLTRTTEGEVAFLENHAPFLGLLAANETRIWIQGGEVRSFDIAGGFVEVSGNKVSILVETAAVTADEPGDSDG